MSELCGLFVKGKYKKILFVQGNVLVGSCGDLKVKKIINNNKMKSPKCKESIKKNQQNVKYELRHKIFVDLTLSTFHSYT